MKKLLIKIIILSMVFYGLGPTLLKASAEENNAVIDEKIMNANDSYEVELLEYLESSAVTDQNGFVHEVDVESELGIENENFTMSVEESFTSEEVNIETNLELEEANISSSLIFDEENEKITFTALTTESEETTFEAYDVTIDEIDNNENFIATFTNTETGESYELNTIDAQASILPALVIGLIAKQGIKWAIKKYGPSLLIKSFSKAAIKAGIQKAASFTVTNKHLSSAKGTYAKFNTSSQSTVRSWIKEGLGKSNLSISLNNSDKLSFVIIANMGKKVGTKGQTKIKIVVDYTGKIWTAYPVN